MGKVDISFAPRLMGQAAAAAYLGISATTLSNLGLPRRQLGGRRLYDRFDLDAYVSDLPLEGVEQAEEENTCDGLFGRKR